MKTYLLIPFLRFNNQSILIDNNPINGINVNDLKELDDNLKYIASRKDWTDMEFWELKEKLLNVAGKNTPGINKFNFDKLPNTIMIFCDDKK